VSAPGATQETAEAPIEAAPSRALHTDSTGRRTSRRRLPVEFLHPPTPTSGADEPAPQRHRAAGALAWVSLIALFPLLRLAVFLSKPAGLQQREFVDDFYYYALIARHIADGDGSTFTGLVPTNGYQPLWEVLLVPLARLADGDAFLRLTFVVETVLFALTMALAYLIARRVGVTLAGAYAAAYATGIGTCAGHLFFHGMEIVLVLPLLLAVVHVVLVLCTPGRTPRPVRDGLALGALLLLLAMARLDTLAFTAVLGAALLVQRTWRRNRLGTVAVAAGVLALGLLGYAGLNAALFGTPVPISGQAKALGGGALRADLVEQYLSFGVLGPLHGCLGGQALLAGVAALVLLRRAAVRQRPLLGWADRPVAAVLAALLVGQLLQLAYYTTTSSWPFWEWYFYYIPGTLLVGLLVIVKAVLATRVGALARRPGLALAAGLAACALTVGVSWGPPPADFWDGGVPATAEWINANTAPTDVIAVGDRAGYLSWLTRRPMVQLEGLVEDQDFLDVIADRRIAEHLSDQHVQYYVRGDDDLVGAGAVAVPDRAGCAGYLEPAQGNGPKSPVTACDGDLVYDAVGAVSQWRIWRYVG
jgi:hypothetical protein